MVVEKNFHDLPGAQLLLLAPAPVAPPCRALPYGRASAWSNELPTPPPAPASCSCSRTGPSLTVGLLLGITSFLLLRLLLLLLLPPASWSCSLLLQSLPRSTF